MFRCFIESKRSHFACMAEGNAALRAFACFSPVTLSENPFARPFSRSTRLVPRFHAAPLQLPFLFFFLFFFFYANFTPWRTNNDSAWNERTTRWLDLDYCSRKFWHVSFSSLLVISFENRISTFLIHNFSLSLQTFLNAMKL